MKILLALWVLAAEPVSPEETAKIQLEQKKANDEIDKKYSNKKSSELTTDERHQQMKDRAEADKAVLDRHNVDAKDYARSQAKQSLDDRAATKAATEKLEKQDADGAKKSDGSKEIIVEKNGKGAMSDQEQAAAADKAAGYDKKKTSAPAKKKKKSSDE